jgi:hypothetical protein
MLVELASHLIGMTSPYEADPILNSGRSSSRCLENRKIKPTWAFLTLEIYPALIMRLGKEPDLLYSCQSAFVERLIQESHYVLNKWKDILAEEVNQIFDSTLALVACTWHSTEGVKIWVPPRDPFEIVGIVTSLTALNEQSEPGTKVALKFGSEVYTVGMNNEFTIVILDEGWSGLLTLWCTEISKPRGIVKGCRNADEVLSSGVELFERSILQVLYRG